MTPLPTMNYKHDLKAIISYKFPYNDNKMIILVNIRVSTCSNSLKYLGIVFTPPPYSAGGGVEPLTNFLKRGDLTEPQFLEGGDIFQGVAIFQQKIN